VSGEFASLMTLAHNGYGHAPTLFSETMTSFVRAGAQLVITYAAEMLSEVAHG
jgi:delta-aminolevulinic acid dehydratase/porphobilinogen synthase